LQAFHFRGVGKFRQAHMALALPGFAGEDMAVAGLFVFEAAAGSRLESFGRAPVGFDFRHGLTSYSGFGSKKIIINYNPQKAKVKK
jgi:hypothetical protein